MRLFNFAVAITALSTLTPVSMASMDGNIIQRALTIPQKCRWDFERAKHRFIPFYNRTRAKLCRDDQKLTFAEIKEIPDTLGPYWIDLFARNVRKYSLGKVPELPPGVLDSLHGLYNEVRENCLLAPEWGIVNHPDLCTIDGDEKLTQLVTGCIKPIVVPKYLMKLMGRVSELNRYCGTLTPFILDVLRFTRIPNRKGGTHSP